MLKSTLIVLIGVFFVLNGLNHLFNSQVLAEYAHRRRLKYGRQLVALTGVLLVAGGVGFVIPALRVPAIVGLSLFLILAMVLIHHFWTEPDREGRLHEALHFSKNLLILVELIYIGFA